MQEELATALSGYVSRVVRRCVAIGATNAPAAATRQVYADPTWWDSRFQETDETFDWYATYKELGDLFNDWSPATPELQSLMVGCGNSKFSAEMHEAGYRRIVNIDISAAAVAKMEARFTNLGLEWLAMDATKMDFEDDKFDFVVDKGTLDAMMCGTDETMVGAMVGEIWRTLRPGGFCILVSHSALRHDLLDRGAQRTGGPAAAWKRRELRKCRLSPQATLINILRNKLQGRPLAEAFRNPEMLKEAAHETKQTLARMRFIDAFREWRQFKAVKAGSSLEDAAAAMPAVTAAGKEEDKEKETGQRSLLQPFCWAYVLQKPPAGTK